MSAPIEIGSSQRWLVLAPHPDDETLATGGLLHRLASRGAATRLLLLTLGENNPWPQRYLDRRWSIGEEERRAWGARRLGECREALRRLGVAPEDALHALGWPDGELRAEILREPETLVARLAGELEAFAPTHLVLPSADDRHPDHNTAAVAASFALERVRRRPATLAYLVHGAARAAPDCVLSLDAREVDIKLEALRAHRTQLALSRRRFEALVRAEVGFYADPFADTTRAAPEVRVRARGDALALEIEPIRPPVWRLRRARLELVWEDDAGFLHARMLKLGRRTPDDVDWRRRRRVLSVSLAAPGGVRRLYAKIATGLHGLWIYDQAGWRRGRIVS
jgi:LmbE family N-acetylglucosaminyl deacetylase